jgi:hypothetical protein
MTRYMPLKTVIVYSVATNGGRYNRNRLKLGDNNDKLGKYTCTIVRKMVQ